MKTVREILNIDGLCDSEKLMRIFDLLERANLNLLDFNPSRQIVHNIWDIEDVASKVEEMGYPVQTEDALFEILMSAGLALKDCEGDWYDIENAINEALGER